MQINKIIYVFCRVVHLVGSIPSIAILYTGSITIITCCIIHRHHILDHSPFINCCFVRRHHLLLHSQSSASESLTVILWCITRRHHMQHHSRRCHMLHHSPSSLLCHFTSIRLEWFIDSLHLMSSPPHAADQILYVSNSNDWGYTFGCSLNLYQYVLIYRFTFLIVHCSCV